jgi:hypothetical protein
MNSDSEAIRDWLTWLLQDPNPTVVAPSGETSSQGTGPDEFGAGDPLLNHFDPLDSEEVAMLTSIQGSNRFSFEESLFFEFGDKPAVQDRFHTLLKRRLRIEIERNPPRFPWETEVYSYEGELQDSAAPELVMPQLWTIQLQSLNLPVSMPETVLTSLFHQCQAVVQSSLREGTKLVQVVETLFPGQSQALNHLAGMVLVAPTRSGATAPPRTEGFPDRYETATATQQMLLSLLAAREMIQALTLAVSPEQPKIQRQWQTAVGQLSLKADYQPQSQRLRIEGQLPCGGSLRLQGEQVSQAERGDAGYLSVELPAPEPSQVCGLEIQLAAQPSPLLFAVRLAIDSED